MLECDPFRFRLYSGYLRRFPDLSDIFPAKLSPRASSGRDTCPIEPRTPDRAGPSILVPNTFVSVPHEPSWFELDPTRE